MFSRESWDKHWKDYWISDQSKGFLRLMPRAEDKGKCENKILNFPL